MGSAREVRHAQSPPVSRGNDEFMSLESGTRPSNPSGGQQYGRSEGESSLLPLLVGKATPTEEMCVSFSSEAKTQAILQPHLSLA